MTRTHAELPAAFLAVHFEGLRVQARPQQQWEGANPVDSLILSTLTSPAGSSTTGETDIVVNFAPEGSSTLTSLNLGPFPALQPIMDKLKQKDSAAKDLWALLAQASLTPQTPLSSPEAEQALTLVKQTLAAQVPHWLENGRIREVRGKQDAWRTAYLVRPPQKGEVPQLGNAAKEAPPTGPVKTKAPEGFYPALQVKPAARTEAIGKEASATAVGVGTGAGLGYGLYLTGVTLFSTVMDRVPKSDDVMDLGIGLVLGLAALLGIRSHRNQRLENNRKLGE